MHAANFFQDLRYGARTVIAQPGFSLIIVLTLALAIGANTVTFSFTNILVLRPLPVQDQDTLGWIFTVDPQRGGDRGSVSIPDLLDYGVISYSVSQRVQEIGIRMALGAVPGDIRTMVIRQTLVLIAAGTVFGLAGGAALARAASSILYEVSPSDPTTYVAVAGVLAVVAALSALAPVRRATRIDPLMALRAE